MQHQALSPSAHQDTFTRDHLPPQESWPTFEFTVPEVRYPVQLNAATELITRAAADFGADRPALHAPGLPSWSYGELLRRSNQIAQVFREDLGVIPGNRVMLRAPNNQWLVACWLAVLKVGAVVVTTSPALRTGEVRQLIELTSPSVLVCDHRSTGDLPVDGSGPDGAPSLPTTVVFGGAGPEDLIARCGLKSGEFTDVATAADDVALLGPTSGSTGVPKITMHFHRDVLANADTFARYLLAPVPDDVFGGSPPLAFTFGLGGLVVFPLRFGASTLLTEKAAPVELAQLCHDAGVTVLFTAPTAYRAIVKQGKVALLAGLRIGVSAGEHLGADVWQQVFDATGLRLVDGIGATEMLHVFVSAAGEDIRPGATGRAVPGYRIAVLDEHGQAAGIGVPGRLAVIGPTGCRYLSGDRQADYVKDGWNITGDVFEMDADGYLTFHARSDSMIVSSGYNIGAPEVEDAIQKHPAVLETAVVARPDSERGSVVCAFVVLTPGVEPSATIRKDIQDFVKQQIAPYKYPREVRFIAALPRNPSGKLQHYRLREDLADEGSREGAVGTAAATDGTHP
ncbi:AMP-binding protein [Nakamurella sp. A5-74]|uniref:AMP-binding protein n=1 Tax=Nakamurella sp. A5-74 TaxID=3158264 RepID=A0AAU8DUJ2_9ACTN